jgi:hypothetical protein
MVAHLVETSPSYIKLNIPLPKAHHRMHSNPHTDNIKLTLFTLIIHRELLAVELHCLLQRFDIGHQLNNP